MGSKSGLLFCLCLFGFGSPARCQSSDTSAAPTGTLVVVVTGLSSDSGIVQVGLFSSEASFEQTRDKFRWAVAGITRREARVVFEGIPYGEYAIKLFHDENRDNVLNTNFLGIPSEGIGFSNNARPLFGPPSFEKAKFLVTSPESNVEIEIFHFF